MNADSHFEIGKDHLICEDYALSGKTENGAYAIVSDGCSSSPSVDLGARVLAQSSLRNITMGLMDDYFQFGEVTARNAERIYEVLPNLSRQAMDATLMVAHVQKNVLTTFMYGDGVIYQKFNNGDARAIHVGFPSGAPAYLSYFLHEGRMTAYKELSKTKVVKDVLFRNGLVTSVTETEIPPFDPVTIQCAVTEGDLICLSSDGINSFRKADSDLMPWTDLIDEFFDYKNTNGVFATRRLAAFQRKCLKEQITHFDDISVASIVV